MSSQIKCEVGPDSEHTPELPLDFSTHKNKKSRITSFSIGKAGLDLEPMKSPSEILNLTKEDRSSSPCSQRSWSSACSLSPSMEGGTTQSQLTPSLGLGLSNLGLTSNGVPHPPGQGGLDLLQSPFQLGQLQYPLNISPWGMVPPPSSLSPGSMGADLYPPNGGNGGGIVGGNGTSGGKVRTTRPFKVGLIIAYRLFTEVLVIDSIFISFLSDRLTPRIPCHSPCTGFQELPGARSSLSKVSKHTPSSGSRCCPRLSFREEDGRRLWEAVVGARGQARRNLCRSSRIS